MDVDILLTIRLTEASLWFHHISCLQDIQSFRTRILLFPEYWQISVLRLTHSASPYSAYLRIQFGIFTVETWNPR